MRRFRRIMHECEYNIHRVVPKASTPPCFVQQVVAIAVLGKVMGWWIWVFGHAINTYGTVVNT